MAIKITTTDGMVLEFDTVEQRLDIGGDADV